MPKELVNESIVICKALKALICDNDKDCFDESKYEI